VARKNFTIPVKTYQYRGCRQFSTFSDFIFKTDKLALTEAQRTRRNPGLKEFWATAKKICIYWLSPCLCASVWVFWFRLVRVRYT